MTSNYFLPRNKQRYINIIIIIIIIIIIYDLCPTPNIKYKYKQVTHGLGFDPRHFHKF